MPGSRAHRSAASPGSTGSPGERVFDRLVDEHRAVISYSTVRQYVKARRSAIAVEAGNAPVEVFVPQEHAPGAEAEMDFGDVWVALAGVRTRCYMFAFRLSNSGKSVHRVYPTCAQEAFLEGHIEAFTVLGGVPSRHIRYDNLTSAVTKVVYGAGRHRVENERWVRFKSHYGFDAFYCEPGIKGAHEKGGIEGEVGRFRRNFLTPVPAVATLAELNDRLRVWDDPEDRRRISQRLRTVGQDFAAEQPLLAPLPAEGFDPGLVLTPRVDRSSLMIHEVFRSGRCDWTSVAPSSSSRSSPNGKKKHPWPSAPTNPSPAGPRLSPTHAFAPPSSTDSPSKAPSSKPEPTPAVSPTPSTEPHSPRNPRHGVSSGRFSHRRLLPNSRSGAIPYGGRLPSSNLTSSDHSDVTNTYSSLILFIPGRYFWYAGPGIHGTRGIQMLLRRLTRISAFFALLFNTQPPCPPRRTAGPAINGAPQPLPSILMAAKAGKIPAAGQRPLPTGPARPISTSMSRREPPTFVCARHGSPMSRGTVLPTVLPPEACTTNECVPNFVLHRRVHLHNNPRRCCP